MTAAYQLSFPEVDPDHACRVLASVNATINWDNDHTRITYHLYDCQIELFADPSPVMLIHGPTDDAVHHAASQLGYPDINDIAIEVQDEAPVRP